MKTKYKIKGVKFIIITSLLYLIFFESYAFNQQNEQQMYIGCYQNSKQYLGAEKAKNYCKCTVKKLSKRFSDDDLDAVFNQKPEEIIEDTKFASEFCEKKIL